VRRLGGDGENLQGGCGGKTIVFLSSMGHSKGIRRWWHKRSIHNNLTPQRKLVHPLHDNCMDKEVANRICSKETMAECWRLWDSFYDRLAQLAQDLLAEDTAHRL
jgi:hypothetical protein